MTLHYIILIELSNSLQWLIYRADTLNLLATLRLFNDTQCTSILKTCLPKNVQRETLLVMKWILINERASTEHPFACWDHKSDVSPQKQGRTCPLTQHAHVKRVDVYPSKVGLRKNARALAGRFHRHSVLVEADQSPGTPKARNIHSCTPPPCQNQGDTTLTSSALAKPPTTHPRNMTEHYY